MTIYCSNIYTQFVEILPNINWYFNRVEGNLQYGYISIPPTN